MTARERAALERQQILNGILKAQNESFLLRDPNSKRLLSEQACAMVCIYHPGGQASEVKRMWQVTLNRKAGSISLAFGIEALRSRHSEFQQFRVLWEQDLRLNEIQYHLARKSYGDYVDRIKKICKDMGDFLTVYKNALLEKEVERQYQFKFDVNGARYEIPGLSFLIREEKVIATTGSTSVKHLKLLMIRIVLAWHLPLGTNHGEIPQKELNINPRTKLQSYNNVLSAALKSAESRELPPVQLCPSSHTVNDLSINPTRQKSATHKRKRDLSTEDIIIVESPPKQQPTNLRVGLAPTNSGPSQNAVQNEKMQPNPQRKRRQPKQHPQLLAPDNKSGIRKRIWEKTPMNRGRSVTTQFELSLSTQRPRHPQSLPSERHRSSSKKTEALSSGSQRRHCLPPRGYFSCDLKIPPHSPLNNVAGEQHNPLHPPTFFALPQEINTPNTLPTPPSFSVPATGTSQNIKILGSGALPTPPAEETGGYGYPRKSETLNMDLKIRVFLWPMWPVPDREQEDVAVNMRREVERERWLPFMPRDVLDEDILEKSWGEQYEWPWEEDESEDDMESIRRSRLGRGAKV